MYNNNNFNNENNFNNQPLNSNGMGYQPMMNQGVQPEYNNQVNQPMMNQGMQPDYNNQVNQPMMNQGMQPEYNNQVNQPMMNQGVQPVYNNQQNYNTYSTGNDGYNSNTIINNDNIFTINNNSNSNVSQVPENMTKGIVGAVVGALIGAIVLVILYQIGRVAVISGIAIAALTILGYEKLGGKMTKKSLAICIIIMIVIVFAAHNIAVALTISSNLQKYGYNISFMDVLTNVFTYIEDGIIKSSAYWGNLLLNYIFCLIGGFYIVKDKLTQIKNS